MKPKKQMLRAILGLVLSVSGFADSYQALDRANEVLGDQIQQRLQSNQQGISTEQRILLQQQRAADQRALSLNQKSARAAKAADQQMAPQLAKGRGVSSDFLYAMQLQQSQAAQAASSAKKGGEGGSSAASPVASPNPAFQTQQLQVPEAKFDTSVSDDKAPALEDLQKQVANLEKALKEPTANKQMSVDDSINQEIADLKSANETRITLMKAAAAFALEAKRQREHPDSKPAEKTIGEALKDLGENDRATSALAQAAEDVAKVAVPGREASKGNGQSDSAVAQKVKSEKTAR